MKLSYALPVWSLVYCCLAFVYITHGQSYEFFPCSMLSSSRCLLQETEVEKECECQSRCDGDDRCGVVFYNPDTKKCRLYDHTEEQIETTVWKCATSSIIDCGKPVFNAAMDVTYTNTTYGSVAEIECALGYRPTAEHLQSVCQISGQWSKPTGVCKVIDCGKPVFNAAMDVTYTSTTYGSVAEIECDLGYFPTAEPLQSVCQASGQWSKLTGVCKRYRSTGEKELPDSDAILECRNEISAPVPNTHASQTVLCADEELTTGCSTTSDRDMQPTPAVTTKDGCVTKELEGSQAVARCCKLPGLRCEGIRNLELSDSISCYKDSYLFNCMCRRDKSSLGPCPVTMNGNQCINPNQTAGLYADRYAICCDLGDYSCYRKEVTGLESAGSDHLKIRCANVGEVMTSCSGFSIDYGVYGSLIQVVDGTDECQLDPGPNNIKALYGYATCCKRQQG